MTRLEKAELLKSKGYTYDADTGKIFGITGNEIISKHSGGYIRIGGSNHFKGHLLGHHFAWYMTYRNVDFNMLDHINRDKTDNRISNLRISNTQKNAFNKNSKGYSWHKKAQKWESKIMLNGKNIYLGLFDTEEQAENAYLNAKLKYHII